MTIGYLFVISNNFCFIIVSSHGRIESRICRIYRGEELIVDREKWIAVRSGLVQFRQQRWLFPNIFILPNLQEIPLPGHQLKGYGLINP